VYCDKKADWVRMGVLDGMVIVEGEGQFWG